MKEIVISKGFKVKVCDCHYGQVSRYKWSSTSFGRKERKWYAIRGTHTTKNGQHIRKSFLMHRDIMGNPINKVVDHINGDTLDNRCENLRICNQTQNNANQRGAKKNSKSGVKGVYWHKGAKKWCAEVIHNKKKYYCGLFDTLDEARQARNAKAEELHGEFYYPG